MKPGILKKITASIHITKFVPCMNTNHVWCAAQTKQLLSMQCSQLCFASTLWSLNIPLSTHSQTQSVHSLSLTWHKLHIHSKQEILLFIFQFILPSD